MTDAGTLDHLHHLDAESQRFGEVLRGTDPASRVPSCPEWDADDLLWHLADVHWFWGEIVRGGLVDLDQVEEVADAERPDSLEETLAFYDRTRQALVTALAARAPADRAWTWSAEQSVGWIRRRMAHEALVHRVDAELAAGDRTPMDPALSADGVDEALRVMYGGSDDRSSFRPDPGRTLRLAASDTGDSWLVTLGRTSGAPGGSDADEPDLGVAASDDGAPAAATLTATAADLDCWLWHRPPLAEVERVGDASVVADFEAVIAAGVT